MSGKRRIGALSDRNELTGLNDEGRKNFVAIKNAIVITLQHVVMLAKLRREIANTPRQ